MNKWFESKNLANYAKSALIQAQKKIDQVLDIKEEEIIGQTEVAILQNNVSPTSSSTNIDQTAPILKSSSNSSIISNASSKQKNDNNKNKELESESDSFFTTFLSSNRSNNNTRSNSPILSQKTQNQDENELKFEEFLNENLNTNIFLNTNNINNASSATSIKNVSPNPTLIPKITNEQLNNLNPQNNENEQLNKNKRHTSTSSSKSSKSKNQLKESQQQLQNSALDIKSIEKDKWIQNYVESSITTSSSSTASTLSNNSKQTQIQDVIKTTETVMNNDFNKETSVIFINADGKEENHNDKSISFVELTNSSTNADSDESTMAIKPGVSNLDNFYEKDINKIDISTEVLDLNDSKLDEKIDRINEMNNENEKVSFHSDKEIKRIINNTVSDLDFVKIDGAGSSLSGNASSTEEGLETCASSDIEVLSLPSNNGDQLLKLSKNIHQISTTGKINSSTTTPMSSINDPNLKGTGLNSDLQKSNSSQTLQSHANNMHSQLIANSNVMQIFVKSPLQTEIAHKTEDSSKEHLSSSNDDLTSSRNLLEAREAHILKLNKQNVKLQEENDNLVNEIEKIKFENNEKIQTLQKNYNELNSKYEQANIDKEQLKKVLQKNDLQKELIELKNVLKEKEQQVEQLTQEGMKLSKQELNQSNIIKKLRAKEKENEELLTGLRNDYTKSQKELEELRRILDAKEEMEIKNIDSFKKLEKAAVVLEKELSNAKSALEDSEEKNKSLENTLQNAFKELAELHKANAAKESKINETNNSIESQLKEEIQNAIEKERIISNKKQESLKWELQSVRADITRIEQQHAIREDMLRKEIADLQQQLRDSEMRNNELSQNISNATRPLLRQIENLQTSHASQIELLENSERNLIERLKETQTNLCEISEKNRQNEENLIDLNQQVKKYEAQIQTLKLEKSKLNAEYQMVKTNLETYENEKYEKEAQHKVLIGSLNQQIETLTREKKFLESQLEIEKVKTENDSKKFQTLLNEYTKERELQSQIKQNQFQTQVNSNLNDSISSSPVPTTPTSLSKFTSSLYESNKTELGSRSGFEFGSKNSGVFNILENLQSKLKLKEGEIIQLQREIRDLERIRESMAKEMINLSNKLENMEVKLKEYPELQEKYSKLNIEYNALLQMYGEKTEENEELKLDIQDVKEMYKLQIEDLIKRSNM